ncbi:MAG: hypothetical protein AAF065_07905 [Verrucomicrobiota bacterium]
MSSKGVLIIEFDQVGNDVILSYSGSVDLADSFAGDVSINAFTTRTLNRFGPSGSDFIRSFGYERYDGEDLLLDDFSTKTISPGGTYSGITIASDELFIEETVFSISIDDSPDFSELSAEAGGDLEGVTELFANQNFETLGLDHHATNTEIDLWRVIGTAGGENLVQFRINTPIPEPSLYSLIVGFIALSSAALSRRRRH